MNIVIVKSCAQSNHFRIIKSSKTDTDMIIFYCCVLCSIWYLSPWFFSFEHIYLLISFIWSPPFFYWPPFSCLLIALWVFISLFRKWNIFFQINIVTLILIENCWNLFYTIDNSQKIMPNIFLDQIWPIFAEIFTKNMKGSPANSEILCVNQVDRDLKKSRKQQF